MCLMRPDPVFSVLLPTQARLNEFLIPLRGIFG